MIERKEIETIKVGKRTLYNLEGYLKQYKKETKNKRNISYCRVSSNKQKEDLERQIEYMKEKYPENEIISDIGSGLNYERKGLKQIMEYAINGEINELVIAYKDRLTRFGYELIEWLIEKYSKGKIIIINKKEEETPEEEIVKDITTIMNVYVAKMNGLRKYAKEIKENIKNKKIENEK
jgi:predicted site-specific integrase-resolvase